jgi:hypothetical protein
MPVSREDLSVYQGDDHSWVVTVRNQDGTPADITGYTARAQIRRAVADSDPIVVAEMASSVASPVVNLSLTRTQTATMNGRYVWDLQLTSDTGTVTTILAGNVNVKPEVTRVTVTAQLEAVAA